MGAPRKGKAGSKSKSSKKAEGKTKEPKKPQPQVDPTKEAQLQLLPQERVQNVKPCWETIPDEQRVELLSVDLNELKVKADDLAEKAKKQAALEAAEAAELNDGTTITVSLEPGLDEIFDEGTRRLQEKSTWKLWQWPPQEREFFDADSFRQYAEEYHISQELRKLLPRDEGKPIEKPAERALRERMSELLQKVHATNRQLQDNMQTQQTRRVGRRDRSNSTDQVPDLIRDSNIELITIILEALEKEHEYLYNAVLYPVTHFVCEMLPEQMRESTRTELFFDDLEKLPSMEVARICEWLTEKVDGFSSKTRAEPKDAEEEEEEEGIGDVDLFTLTEDRTKLVVNVKWLQHLQERLLGEDGHPRKVHEGEDPHRMGLVLEWVYGTIVSTAEKARDGAKRALGMQPPTVDQAHEQLIGALQDMQSWEARAKTAKELLNDMLKSRREAAELATKFDIRPNPTGRTGLPHNALMAIDGQEDSFAKESEELPDSVIIALLKREHLLTRAKLNALYYEHITGERKLRSLKTQLRQGEPEFDRLKRELEEVKNQPRGLEGTFRTAAEMERHRAQLADAAIEEQLEVQTAFREHGARLQGIYDKRQRTEHEMVHREQEIKQLQGWAQTVQNLVNKFEDGLNELGPLAAIEEVEAGLATPEEDTPPAVDEEVPSAVATARALTNRARDLTAHRQGIAKLRQHFSKDVRRQLYGDEDDRKFFQWVQSQLKQTETRLENGRAVLHHLEAQLINVACDDPGAAIGAQLALPLLQERLDAKAQEFARQKAAQAEEDIIKMEEVKLEKERLERERKLKQKQKAKDRVRSEKEKLAAEKEAAEREARERSEEQLRLQEQQSLAAREAAATKREELKRAEEELMEARRQELLSEEDGYWRQRMNQQQLVEKLKAEVAEQEELKGHSEDGTEDTSPSSATPVDDASDAAPAPALPSSSVPEDEEDRPSANGFHLPNGSAVTDSDGFRRQHERRPVANANARAGPRRTEHQQSDDNFRQRYRGPNQQGGSRDRNDGFFNRGSSADRFPRQSGNRDGSSDRSEQDRFGPRRFNRDSDRIMGRGRRMDRPHPSREPVRPLNTSRQTSANTVSASRGADGRIEIAAEPARVPSVTRPPPEATAPGPAKPPAAKSAPVPVHDSPTSPLPAAIQSDVATTSGPASARIAQHPGQTAVQAEPTAHPSAPSSHAAELASAQPSVAPSETPASSQSQSTNAPPKLPADAPHVNQSMPHTPPTQHSPSTSSGASPAQQAPQVPPVPQHPHMLPAVPNMPAANGSSNEAGAPQVPPPAAPLQQVPAPKPKPVPAPGMPMSHLPHGYAAPQQPAGTQPSLPGLNGRSRPFTPQQPPVMQQPQMHLQQQQQQQLAQQVPRRQLEKLGQPPYSMGPDPRQHLGPSMLPNMLPGQPSAAEQAQSLAGQSRVMHLPQSGAPRSSSIGQKRPMPNQDMPHYHAPPHPLASPQQQRGPPKPAGPPMMPFNGSMMPFLSSPNGMPNASMPGSQAPNGMPFLMQPSPRPHMMTGMPLMNPLNVAMGKSAPMHQHGGPPFGANPYMQMQHMPNHINTSAPRPQAFQVPPQMHSGPQPHHQIQTTGMLAPAPTPPQQSLSGTLPNGHLRPPQTAALSPASSLGNSAKGSSTLRASAVPFIPGGMAQPASPLATAAAHGTPAGGPHLQHVPQGPPRQAGVGVVMGAPFYPNAELPGARDPQPQAAQQPVDSQLGHLQPAHSPDAGNRDFTASGSTPAQAASPSLLNSGVPTFMADLLPQDLAVVPGSEPSHQDLQSSSEVSVASPPTPYRAAGETSQPGAVAGKASSATDNTQLGAHFSMSGTGQVDSRSSDAASDASIGTTSQPLLGDSPKACWSQVAASRDDESQQGGFRQPRGSSPLSEGARGQARPSQPPRSISGASAATQDSSASGYTRTDSGDSARDASGVNERRASGAAAGPSSTLLQGSSTSSPTSHRRGAGGKARIVKRHGLVYEDKCDGMVRLKLVRGLSNMQGQHNCFLNVIIQSLWHLPAFRTALLNLPLAPTNSGSSPKDTAVAQALQRVFVALSKSPPEAQQAAAQRDAEVQSAFAGSLPAQQLQQQEQVESSGSAAASSDANAVRQSISPDELRDALSQLEKGQTPIKFDLSEMHDAAEVLGEVFNCLHRAQLGSAATSGVDPQLPQLVRVSRATSSSSLTGLATPFTQPHTPASMAQDIFGQKVQVPCPPDDLDSPVSKKARADTGQWQQQQSKATANQQRQQAQQQQQQQAAAKRQSKDTNLVDMHQFWKYFHLVPAQAIRTAYDSLNRQGSFEAVLREADSAEALLKRSHPSGSAPLLDVTLLNPPRVFTLALVWESAKVWLQKPSLLQWMPSKTR
ncbi:hypothetical protein ABBQ32_013356 [Trebouxia sp. C0010 RCD-2024]